MISKSLFLVLYALFVVVPAESGQIAAGRAPRASLTVDYERSWIVAKLNKAGLLRFLGHEHGVLVTEWTADVTFDEADLDSARLVVEIDVSGLIIDSPRARELADVDPDGPSEEEIEEIRAEMLSDEQLDAEQYPVIRFESESLRLRGSRLDITGTLSLHGASRRIEVESELERSDGGHVLRGDFEIKHRDFGIEPVSIGGVVKVADDIDVSFEIFAR